MAPVMSFTFDVFSKVMLPGLRLAAAAVPNSIIPLLHLYKQSADLSTSVLSQGVLEIYLKSGMYDHHAKRMKSLYNHRMNKLRDISRRVLPEDSLYSIQSSGGLFSAIRLSDVNKEELIRQLNNRGVDVLAADRQYLSSFPKMNLLRMSIIRTDERDIEEGLGIIAEEMERAERTRGSSKPFSWL